MKILQGNEKYNEIIEPGDLIGYKNATGNFINCLVVELKDSEKNNGLWPLALMEIDSCKIVDHIRKNINVTNDNNYKMIAKHKDIALKILNK